jgi:uncharacterized protein (DUF952 family)
VERIFHIASAATWGESGDAYSGDTLASEGFIHCSTADQVLDVAHARFGGRRDLVLLCIDPARVAPEIRYENLEGGEELFPHIYGPLDRKAVIRAEPLEPGADGRFTPTPALRDVSRSHEDLETQHGSVVLLLKNLLFTFVVPGTVAVYVPLSLAGDLTIGSGPLAIAAWPLLGLGCAIYAWCVWDFASFGRGTPAPIDAPSKLVVRGLYRYSRNPMYVGVLAVILGQAALFEAPRTLLWGVGVGVCFHLFVLLYEEPHLARVFGASYEDYRSRVGRWLPTIRRS